MFILFKFLKVVWSQNEWLDVREAQKFHYHRNKLVSIYFVFVIVCET